MAKESEKEKDDSESESKVEGKGLKSRFAWIRSKQVRNIAGMLVVATFIAGSLTILLRPRDSSGNLSREVSLGDFSYFPRAGVASSTERAEFSLHISLLPKTDQLGRYLLSSHEFKVQQNIEELLRRANGGDFDDPTLNELKRQLQATINETLGEHVIEDVIITDLLVSHRAEEPEEEVASDEEPPAQPDTDHVGQWDEVPPTP